jgi:hypothetical protein
LKWLINISTKIVLCFRHDFFVISNKKVYFVCAAK